MSRMRSLLFVPGDSEKKLAKSEEIPADVLILDLEDSVSPQNKTAARGLVAEYLAGRRAKGTSQNPSKQIWVRINPMDHAEAGPDLAAVVVAGADGIVLPKARGPEDIELLGRRIGAYEQEYELKVGSTRILPVATETPQSIFTLGDYRQCGHAPGGPDLGSRRPERCGWRHCQPGRVRVTGLHLTNWYVACACLLRMQPGLPPLTHCMPISET